MKKTRLRSNHRSKLTKYAEQIVDALEERAALDAATQALTDYVVDLFARMFPERDMRVLSKYGMTAKVKEFEAYFDVPVRLDAQARWYRGDNMAPIMDNTPRVTLTAPVTVPFRVVPHHTNFVRVAVGTDARLAQLISAQRVASWQHQARRERKLEDYRALIREATTYEAVIEIWPEAADLRADIAKVEYGLTTLDPAARERIRRDVEERRRVALDATKDGKPTLALVTEGA